MHPKPAGFGKKHSAHLPLSPTSPVILSMSVSDPLRLQVVTVDLPAGGALQCHLFDEPFNGVRFMSAALREMAAGKPAATINLSVSRTEELQGRQLGTTVGSVSMQNSTSPSPPQFSFSQSSLKVLGALDGGRQRRRFEISPPLNSNTSLLFTQNQRSDIVRNVRRGSKIVCGNMNNNNNNNKILAVRVLLVDKMMLKKLRSLVVPQSSLLLQSSQAAEEGEPMERYSKTSMVSVECGKSDKPSVESSQMKISSPNVAENVNNNYSNSTGGDLYENESLPPLFFIRLQQELEEHLLQPVEKHSTYATRDDIATDEKENWQSPLGFTKARRNRNRLGGGDGNAESNDDDNNSRNNSVQKTEGEGNEVGEESMIAPATPSQSADSALMSDSVSEKSVTDSSVRVSFLADANRPEAKSDIARTHDTLHTTRRKNDGISHLVQCQVPIVGVKVFPLDVESNELGERPHASLMFSEERQPSVSAAAVATPLTASVQSTTNKLPPKRGKLTNIKNKPMIKRSPFSLSLQSLRRTHATGKTSLTSSFSNAADMKRGITPQLKASVSGSQLVETSPVDLNASEENARSLRGGAISPFDHVERTSPPVFGIAISLPFVRQGNVHDVFQNWVRMHRPSHLLIETAIRNIIHGVLQHLVVFHREGKAHGSIKATNIFVSSHVMEAMDSLSLNSMDMLLIPSGKYGAAGTDYIRETEKLDGRSDVEDPTSCSNNNCGLAAGAASCGAAGTGCGGSGSGSGCDCRHSKSSTRHYSGGGNTDNNEVSRGDCDDNDGGDGSSRSGENPTDCFAAVEWSKHIILADAYYELVERILMTSLMETRKADSSDMTTHKNSGEHKLHKMCNPLLDVNSFISPELTGNMDALNLFTVQELEYVPPPECITGEGNTNVGKPWGKESTFPESQSTRETGMNSTLPFRRTNNTRNPHCPLTPSYDIWMLGMLAIHLADGGCPWWMKRTDHPLPRLRRDPWSLRFASFVHRCLCMEPERRPSAEELLKDKWFYTTLLEEPKDHGRTTLMRHAPSSSSSLPPPAAASSQSMVSSGNATFLPLRRPCRRAFSDILLEYNEYAEEWCARFLEASTDAMLKKNNSLLTNLSGVDPPELDATTHKHELNISGFFSSRSIHHKYKDSNTNNSNSDNKISSKGRSRSSSMGDSHLSRSTINMMNHSLSPENVCHGIDGFADKMEGCTSESHSRKLQVPRPFFLGALSSALDCGDDEPSSDSEAAEIETYVGASSKSRRTVGGDDGGSRMSPSRQSGTHPHYASSSWDASLVPLKEHQKLAGEFLQAFCNLRRECRLAADVWCVTLMKHMRLDKRTASLVIPVITEETAPFFGVADADMQTAVPGKRNASSLLNPPASAPADGNGSASACGLFQQEGAGVSASMKQQQKQQQQQATSTTTDVSPTAFHNYMFCKWCVTTSWALQQEKRYGGNESKR